MRWGNTNSRDYQKRIALSSRNYDTVNSWNIDNRETKYFPSHWSARHVLSEHSRPQTWLAAGAKMSKPSVTTIWERYQVQMEQICSKGQNYEYILQPAPPTVEDFPVRRNQTRRGLTCQNSLECTLFDNCLQVRVTSFQSIWLRMTGRAELGTWST